MDLPGVLIRQLLQQRQCTSPSAASNKPTDEKLVLEKGKYSIYELIKAWPLQVHYIV